MDNASEISNFSQAAHFTESFKMVALPIEDWQA